MAAITDIVSGAAGGAGLGPWGAVAGGVLGVVPTLAQLFTGGAQRRRARAINPVDPGFVENSGIMENKRLLDQTYGNYSMPGRAGIVNNINNSFAGSTAQLEQGATSSGDLIDGISRLSFAKNKSLVDLGIQEAEMKNALLPAVLDANVAAGGEAVRRNQFDEARYQQDLERKAQLEQAGAITQFKAGDSLATLGGSLLNYRAQPWSRNKTFNPAS